MPLFLKNRWMSFPELYYHIPGFPNEDDYNCSGKSYNEWTAQGMQRPILGIIAIITGLASLTAYSVIILAMSDRKFLSQSCYQIMYCTCFVDMGNLSLGSIMTGIFFIEGAVYCSHPNIISFGGSLGLACWCGSCFQCIALGINRISHMTETATWMFTGYRTWIWISCSFCVLIFFATCTRPVLFNSSLAAWFYYPIIKDRETEMEEFINWLHPIVNVCTAVSLTAIYAFLCSFLTIKNRRITPNFGSKTSSVASRQIFVQALLICSSTAIAAYLYAYMQFFDAPAWFIVAASLAYEAAAAMPCVVYLSLNRTVRRRVKKMITEGRLSKSTEHSTIHRRTSNMSFRSSRPVIGATNELGKNIRLAVSERNSSSY